MASGGGDQLLFRVVAEDNATQTLDRVKQSLQRVTQAADRMGTTHERVAAKTSKAFMRIQAGAQSLVSGLSIAQGGIGALIGLWLAARNPMVFFGAGLVAIASSAIRATSAMQMFENTLRVFLKTNEATNEAVARLVDFAAKTPFTLPQLQETTSLLLAFNFNMDETMYLLRRIGNTAAAMGDMTGESLRSLAMAFGRLRGGGGNIGEAMEQLRRFGISQQTLAARGIEFDSRGRLQSSVTEVMRAITDHMDDQFGGMMEKLNETIPGQVSNMMDAAFQMFAVIGEPLRKPIMAAVQKVGEGMLAFREVLQQFGSIPELMFLGETFRRLSWALEPFLIAFSKIIKISFIGGIWLLTKAIGGLGEVIKLVAMAIEIFNRRMATLWAWVKRALAPFKSLWDAFRKLANMFKHLDFTSFTQALKDFFHNLPEPFATIARMVIRAGEIVIEWGNVNIAQPLKLPNLKQMVGASFQEGGAGKDFFSTLFGVMAFQRTLKILRGLISRFAGFVGRIVGLLLGFGGSGAKAAGMLNPISILITGVLTLLQLFEERTGALSEAWNKFMTDGDWLGALQTIVPHLTAEWDNFLTMLEKVFNKVREKLQEHPSKWSADLQAWVRGLWAKIKPDFDRIVTNVDNWARNLWDKALSPNLAGMLDNIMNWTSDVEFRGFNTDGWLGAITSFISTAGNVMGDGLLGIGRAIGTWALTEGNALRTATLDWVDGITDWILESSPKMLEDLGVWLETSIEWLLGDGLLQFIDAWTEIAGTIAATIGEQVDKIVDAIKEWLFGATGVIKSEETREDVIAAFNSWIEPIKRFFREAVPRIEAAVVGLGAAIARGIYKGLGNLAAGLKDRIVGAISTAASQIDIGAFIRSRVTGGIIPRAKGGIDVVRKPTLFMAGEAGPEVAAFAPLNSGGASLAPVGGGSSQINNFNIVIEGGGGDANAIANRVAETVAQRIRAQRTMSFARRR